MLTIDEWNKPKLSGEEAVREVTVSKKGTSSLQSIYAALTHPSHAVDMIEAVGLPLGDVCYVDEEGLFKETDHWFRIHGYHQPLKGRGLVMGIDREGDGADPQITLETLRRNVQIGTGFCYTFARMAVRNHDGSPSKRQRIEQGTGFTYRVWHRQPWGREGALKP